MCQTLILMLEDKKIYDEATLCLHGLVNKPHSRHCVKSIYVLLIESVMKSPKLNVCCAMSINQLIEPFFSEDDTVNGENYLSNFLFQRFGNDTNFDLFYFNKMVFFDISLSKYDTISRQSFS